MAKLWVSEKNNQERATQVILQRQIAIAYSMNWKYEEKERNTEILLLGEN